MRLLVALLVIIGIVSAQSSFSATIRITNDPNVIGVLNGQINYQWNSASTTDLLNRYSIAYQLPTGQITEVIKTILIPNTSPARYQTNRFMQCSGTCETTSFTTPFPVFDRSQFGAGTGVTLNGQSVTQYNRAGGANDVVTVWYSGSTIVQALFGNGKIWAFTSVTAVNVAAFDVSTWGCPEPKCTVIADIALIFDDSGSIGATNYQQVRNFGVQICNTYAWAVNGADGITMALSTFSGNVNQVFSWTADRGTAVTRIANLAYRNGGSTCIGCGQVESRRLFGVRSSVRASVAKLCFFMTDGQNNVSPPDWVQESINNRNAGITTVGIGVGSGVQISQMQQVASIPPPGLNLVIMVNNFNALTAIKDQLVGVTCSTFPGNPCGANCFGFCGCSSTCLCPTCDNSLYCNPGTCTAGVLGSRCTYSARNCDDNNRCTDDSCNENTDQCDNLPVPASRCDDGNVCTIDSCDPLNGCVHLDRDCSGPDVCTIYGCNPQSGCTTAQKPNCDLCKLPPARTVSRTCPDINGDPDERPNGPCLSWGCSTTITKQVTVGPTTYDLGKCVSSPKNCTEADRCKRYFCDPVLGCRNETINCDDNNSCTDDSCDATFGCRNIPRTLASCPAQNVSQCVNWTLDPTFPGCCRATDLTESLCGGNVTDKCIFVGCRNESGCFYGLRNCELEIGVDNIDECQYAECDSAIGCQKLTLTDKKLDKCGFCDGGSKSINKCIGNLTPTELGSLSAGVIAAIIIAVVVIVIICGLVGGKVGLDYYRKYQGRMNNLQSNPLYEEGQKGGVNPFYADKE